MSEGNLPQLAPMTRAQFVHQVQVLRSLAAKASTEEEVRLITGRIGQLTRRFQMASGIGLPATPMEQAMELDDDYVERPHTRYISDRLTQAVRDVENGQNKHIVISLPPRSGKTRLTSRDFPVWAMRRHPSWNISLVSYDESLSRDWARGIRNVFENNPDLGVELQKDSGAGGSWRTTEGGEMFATSIGGTFTSKGAKILILDDPVRDWADAHKASSREATWRWWLSVATTRLEAPYLAIVIMTRWHADDLVGRLYDPEYEGDPAVWERIVIPAVADSHDDPLGREIGDPLYPPLTDMTRDEALEHWASLKKAVGSSVWASLYQQHPAPVEGALFQNSWWRFWSRFPDRATGDGRVVHFEPETDGLRGQWVDSWDMAFKGAQTSDYVVGQRWVKVEGNRYLVAQQRDRWSFTETLTAFERWSVSDPVVNPAGHLVHQRLVEEKANGAAIIDVMRSKVPGIKAVSPRDSKEARARAVTPEIESGNVYLPYPGDPGNEWVYDFLSELREFPSGAHDDSIDAMTQALSHLRGSGSGQITVPGATAEQLRAGLPAALLRPRGRSLARAAQSDLYRGGRR